MTIMRKNRFMSQPVFAELDGQPIEQLRMRRQLAGDAEISGRFDQPRAEHFLPEAVHRHTRG